MDNKYQGLKFDGRKFDLVDDAIVSERALEIYINEEPFTVTMYSPGNEVYLAHGLLLAEGLIRKDYYPRYEVIHDEDGQVKRVAFIIDMDDYDVSNRRSLLSVASCGICGQRELELPEGNLQDEFQIAPAEIFEHFSKMAEQQNVFVSTGGSHAASIFNEHGDLLVCMEDVGRHNAVDKAIGKLHLEKQLGEAKVMLVSGRVSYEIVVKAFKASIPVLAAVSSPSTLSIDFAKELGITLIGFTREPKLTVYSGVQRLKQAL